MATRAGISRAGSWRSEARLRRSVRDLGDEPAPGVVHRVDVLHESDVNTGATIIGDLTTDGVLPDDAFDCIICNGNCTCCGTFRRAAATASALRPGFSSPFLASRGVHARPRQLGRLVAIHMRVRSPTPDGCVPGGRVEVDSYGNLQSATFFLHGLSADDLSRTSSICMAPTSRSPSRRARSRRRRFHPRRTDTLGPHRRAVSWLRARRAIAAMQHALSLAASPRRRAAVPQDRTSHRQPHAGVQPIDSPRRVCGTRPSRRAHVPGGPGVRTARCHPRTSAWPAVPCRHHVRRRLRDPPPMAVPVLQHVGVPATFFLNGASLQTPRATWWWELMQLGLDRGMGWEQMLPSAVLAEASTGAARPTVTSVGEAVKRMTVDDRRSLNRRLGELVGTSEPSHGMRDADVRALAEAGFEIGFHTVDHEPLALVDAATLHEQLRKAEARSKTPAARRCAASPTRMAVQTTGWPPPRATPASRSDSRAPSSASGQQSIRCSSGEST